jgi:hypothetical protein
MDALPALDQLMGAYFHQDWEDEAADEWAVLDLFVAGEPDTAELLPGEINHVLTQLQSEAELKHLVIEELGGSFLADWDGGTYRGWLTQIADRVRQATGPA